MSSCDTSAETFPVVHLLALHGNGGGASRFDLCAPYFDPHKVAFHAHTLPGFEGRPLDSGRWEEFLADVDSAVLRLPRPRWLLGHGIGASVVLEYLQNHADRLDGAVLNSPVGARLDRRWFPRLMRPRWMREAVRAALSFSPAIPLWSRLLLRPSVPSAQRQRFFREYRRCQAFSHFFDLLTASWFQSLRPVDLPTVLLWGQRERVLSAEHIEAFTPLLPNGRVVRIPEWDHFPMLENPLRYAQVVTQIVLDPHLHWLGGDQVPDEPKARLLDSAVRQGLPVPLAAQLCAPPPALPGLWAVRSTHPEEDSQQRSRAGEFLSVLNQQGDQLAPAYQQVSASQQHPNVLLMEQVPAQHAGVAFLEPDYEDDLINWTSGLADKLLQGEIAGEREPLPRLDFELPLHGGGWRGRLQRLLRDLRGSSFGDQSWDVEWADDGQVCWLLQIRPITRPGRREEFLTAANQREILPDPPSRLMTGLLDRCGLRLFDFYRQFDPTLPSTRPFLTILEGRPFLNLSLLRGLMIRWGLPTRLVTDNVGGGDIGNIPARPRQLLRKLPVHLAMARHQARALSSTRQCQRRLEQLALGLETLPAPELLDRFCEIYIALVHQMMTLTAGMSLPLSGLRACGTLAEHNARFEVESSAMLWQRDLSRSQYLQRFGHRGPFESDLARPRIGEDLEPWLEALQNLDPPPVPPLSWKGWLSLPLAWWAAPLVRAREHLRSDAMRSFQKVRQRFQALVEQSSHRDSLLKPLGDPPLPAFWNLTPDELVAALSEPLAEGFWPERAQEIERSQQQRIPDLVSNFGWTATPESGQDRLRGIPLTRGRVQGRAWVLREPTSRRPEHLQGPVILVARAVDPGWLASFAWADGVAIETGGDLSHGSILLRELGLPAVTNIAGLWSWAKDGEPIELDADLGQVRRA